MNFNVDFRSYGLSLQKRKNLIHLIITGRSLLDVNQRFDAEKLNNENCSGYISLILPFPLNTPLATQHKRPPSYHKFQNHLKRFWVFTDRFKKTVLILKTYCHLLLCFGKDACNIRVLTSNYIYNIYGLSLEQLKLNCSLLYVYVLHIETLFHFRPRL